MTRAAARGPLARAVLGIVVLLALPGGIPPARAQYFAPQFADPPPEPGFLTNVNFHLTLDRFSGDEEQFFGDADFGGDIDVVDFGRGRINVLANYEAVLGREFQLFDPNQGNYTLDVLGSVRWQRQEVAAVFHHVSRHLGDRAKSFPIDWNMLGGQYWTSVEQDGTRLDVRGRVFRVLKRAFVDYDGQLDVDAAVRHTLRPHVALVVRGNLTHVMMDPAVFNRDGQTGGRVEVGVRLDGERGAFEVVSGYERRVDPDAFRGQALDWAFVGFRFLSP